MTRPLPPEHSRFKPGVSGNPSGRPKLPPELKAIKELTTEELRRTIAKYARMTPSQVDTTMADSSTTMIELSIASIFCGAKAGDYAKLAFLLDRSIGKPASEAAAPLGSDIIPVAYVPKSLRGSADEIARYAQVPGEDDEPAKDNPPSDVSSPPGVPS